jgi:hypothetical protein
VVPDGGERHERISSRPAAAVVILQREVGPRCARHGSFDSVLDELHANVAIDDTGGNAPFQK